MIVFTLRVTVSPDHREELEQTIRSLYGQGLEIKGLVNHEMYRDPQEDNTLYLRQAWESRDHFDQHMGSDTFRILKGALDVLADSREMGFDSLSDGVREDVIRFMPHRETEEGARGETASDRRRTVRFGTRKRDDSGSGELRSSDKGYGGERS